MIQFSRLGQKGHLGNQLFQIASTIGMAKRNAMSFGFPEWQWSDSFSKQIPLLESKEAITLQERQFDFHDWNIEPNTNYDLDGYLQSEKYFDKQITSEYFSFAPSIIENVRSKYPDFFTKRTIVLSVRRGDFVDHPDYFQLPVLYYISALTKHFPDWRNANLLFASDDISYCKQHFSFLKNAFFAENLNPVQQLCLGSLCDDFIISNSTFSWWIAYLGEKENSKVIRPAHYFRGKKAEESSDQDYFPDRWLKFDHSQKKMHFQNAKFSFTFDPGQKYILEDLKLIEELLHQDFEATIDFQNDSVELGDRMIHDDSKQFSFFIHNAYILPPMLILESVYKADTAKVKKVLFNVQSFEVPRNPYFKRLSIAKDIGIFGKTNFKSEQPSNCFSIIKTNIGEINDNFETQQFTFSNGYVLKFSHSSNLYFGINEMIGKIRFQIYRFKKFYMKPLLDVFKR